jgi:hypothetical protein
MVIMILSEAMNASAFYKDTDLFLKFQMIKIAANSLTFIAIRVKIKKGYRKFNN